MSIGTTALVFRGESEPPQPVVTPVPAPYVEVRRRARARLAVSQLEIFDAVRKLDTERVIDLVPMYRSVVEERVGSLRHLPTRLREMRRLLVNSDVALRDTIMMRDGDVEVPNAFDGIIVATGMSSCAARRTARSSSPAAAFPSALRVARSCSAAPRCASFGYEEGGSIGAPAISMSPRMTSIASLDDAGRVVGRAVRRVP